MVCQNIFRTTQKLVSISALSLLVACGGGGESSDGNDAAAQTAQLDTGIELSGRAVKGVISSGLVNVYRLLERDGRVVVSADAVGLPVRTDKNGYYSFPLGSSFASQRLVVEVTADNETRMTCELPSGCTESESVAFGEDYTLNSAFSMSSIAEPVVGSRTIKAHITPLTHMARVKAEVADGGLTKGALNAAKASVAAMFDIDTSVIDLEPVDVTNQREITSIDSDLLQAAMVSVALQDLASSSEFDDLHAVLQSIDARLSQHEALVLVDQGLTTEVAIDDLLYRANTELDALTHVVPALSDEVIVATLASLNNAQQDAMDRASLVSAVSIVGQPSSVTASEGDSFTLSVGAIGGGRVAFQWSKDGVVLVGADSSTFSGLASTASAGRYSVLVSNEVGSVRSEAVYVDVMASEAGDAGDSEVGDAATGNISLSWDIPTEREDGTSLELYEIGGYVIAYGLSATSLDHEIDVLGNVTNHDLSALELGVYYFSIATVDSDGVQGRFSDVISVSVN